MKKPRLSVAHRKRCVMKRGPSEDILGECEMSRVSNTKVNEEIKRKIVGFRRPCGSDRAGSDG